MLEQQSAKAKNDRMKDCLREVLFV